MTLEPLNNFSLWGGNNSYDPITETLTINRSYGLFSNITITIWCIAKLKTMGYNVKKLNLYLLEYIRDHNCYSDLFLQIADASNLSKIEADGLVSAIQASPYGLTMGWGDFTKDEIDKNREVLNKIYLMFFNPNNTVNKYYNNIIDKYQILFKKTAFIWARKTDKTSETKIPSAINYYNALNKLCSYNNTVIENILIQTDDNSVIDDFINIPDNRIGILNYIPTSLNNRGFHEQLYAKNDNEFQQTFNCSKIEYLQKILAMVIVASRCEYFVCYPGNLTTIVPLIRGNSERCILFKDSESFA